MGADGSMVLITVRPGEELLHTVARRAAEVGITDAAVVSLIGAVDTCVISNMPAYDARRDIITEYAQPFELCGTGEIINGVVHLHVVLGREGDRALAGHLLRATVTTFYVRVYLIPLPVGNA